MNSSLLLQFSPIILLQKFSLEEHEEKSWLWSINVIAGGNHLPVKIYGPLQKDMWTLAEHGGRILVLEHRCHCWRTSSSSQDLWATSEGYLDVREGW
ncbi:hypothetical protein CDAR_65301 [Caerostris darwini]|uniref:Ycf15 n=1 Tax=Caerostris darwini TaxID=1538125 RepID=A0AAV4R160_9ARAC|nr:hypothetical protein CDAR_65301 [Caerostris darwini]